MLVGYAKMIIANSALQDSLAIYLSGYYPVRTHGIIMPLLLNN